MSSVGPSRALKGLPVLVMGLGRSGVSAAKLLVREGAVVTGTDARSEGEIGPATIGLLRELGVRLETGGHVEASFTGAALIVKSPGVKPSVPELVAARAAGVPVVGEVELCAPFLRGPVIGITGTNGKSTTTALTGHLLVRAGRRPFVGGNLGTPVAEHVLSGAEADATVLELSSYQIDDLETLRVDVAMVLNLTPDHLERYGAMEAYAASKERLLSLRTPGGLAVLNADDAWTRGMAGRAEPPVRTFGHGLPAAGHIRAEAGVLVHREPGGDERRYTVGARALKGAHNLENAMAAALAVRALGVPPEAIQAGLDDYPGLPHRIEHVRTVGGVDFVNDSKATNVDSVEKSLAAFGGPLHLIMGGRGKGASYGPLRRHFGGRMVRLYLIGEDAGRIHEELGADVEDVQQCGDLVTAVDRAAAFARPGDTVLLSPACASWDQFRSFEHRGEEFRKAVMSLPEDL